MSSLQEIDLYNLSVANGYIGAFAEWQSYRGSVLCLNFGTDINIGAGMAPGLKGSWNFQFNVTLANISGVAGQSYQLMCVPIYEGVFTLRDGVASISQGMLTEQDIAEAEAGPVAQTFENAKHVLGGSFFANVWEGIKKAVGVARKVVDNPLIQSAAQQLLPSNVSSILQTAGKYSGRAREHGYGVLGGAALRKKSLKRRAKEY